MSSKATCFVISEPKVQRTCKDVTREADALVFGISRLLISKRKYAPGKWINPALIQILFLQGKRSLLFANRSDLDHAGDVSRFRQGRDVRKGQRNRNTVRAI